MMHQQAGTLKPFEPTSRTLVLFAHYDRNNLIAPYVVNYLNKLRHLGCGILFVSTSDLTAETIQPLIHLCDGIYTKDNYSRDFGSWHHAWKILHQTHTIDDFDRLVIANDSVYGPIFPLTEMWSTFEGADMYGAIACCPHHLQSWFLVWDLDPKTTRFLHRFWNRFEPLPDKNSIIERYECGLSVGAKNNGLIVKPYLSADMIDEAFGSPDATWPDPKLWYVLIEQLRFPFLKRSLRGTDKIVEFIAGNTSYPIKLIGS